jgi:hypothetical protein
MNTKHFFAAIALCASAFAQAGVIGGIDASNFAAPTVEHFNGTAVNQNFGNGMAYQSQTNDNTLNYSGVYDLGGAGFVLGGLEDDGYFITGVGAQTFSFTFAGGATRFGFHGGAWYDRDVSSNGSFTLAFYGLDDMLIDSMLVNTSDLFMWDDFYGFASNSGAIGRVEFQNVNFLVLDDVTFDPASAAATVPEPASLALLGLGLVGFAAARRKSRAK